MATRKKAQSKRVEEVVDTEVKHPVSMPLSELHRSKLELMELRVSSLVKPIQDALVRKYQELLRVDLEQILTTDPVIVAAKKAQSAYVNEVLDEIESLLPEGYAVHMLSHETGNAEATYNPEQRGKRLSTG
jgi:hypothetical protein